MVSLIKSDSARDSRLARLFISLKRACKTILTPFFRLCSLRAEPPARCHVTTAPLQGKFDALLQALRSEGSASATCTLPYPDKYHAAVKYVSSGARGFCNPITLGDAHSLVGMNSIC